MRKVSEEVGGLEEIGKGGDEERGSREERVKRCMQRG